MMESKPPVVEFSAKKFVKFSSHYLQWLWLQACDGAEACIVSCHNDQKVWDGSEYHAEPETNRTLKLSEITGLTLTAVNIEEDEDPHINCVDQQ